jgi:hypothetical protein
MRTVTLTDVITLGAVIAPIVALAGWGVVRVRRSRTEVRAALEQAGYHILRITHRIVWYGPFFWTTSRGQIVYCVVVRETGGRQRTGWARWGRRWLGNPDGIELRWDE